MNEFERTIDQYLKVEMPEAYKEEDIEKVCAYIIKVVKESKRQGFADAEIYKMARDFYNDEIDPDSIFSENATVVVNHTIELSDEDKDKAYQQALRRYEEQQLKELQKAEEKEKKKQEKQKEKELENERKFKESNRDQISLFDFADF